MKKWLIILTGLVILGLVGYKLVMNYAADKMIDEISKNILAKEDIEDLKTDPEIQKQLGSVSTKELMQRIDSKSNKDIQNGSVENNTIQGETDKNIVSKETGVSNSSQSSANINQVSGSKGKLMFANKDEALKFVLTKFTMNELLELAQKAKGGLTNKKKAEIKAVLLERLTPEEFRSLKAIALIELKKGV